MLNNLFGDGLALGAAQAVIAAVLALAVMVVAAYRHIHIERDVVTALARGIVQIVVVGIGLVALLQGPEWTSVFVLAGMMVVAARIASQRAVRVQGAFRVSLYGIGIGAGLVIAMMTWLGVIDPAITSLIPVGSMLVANSMNTCAQALERFRAEVESHAGLVETALALGGDPKDAVAPYVQAAVEASLIPRVDSLRALGIVWIPGIMAGMVISGTPPVQAALYQFVVIAMIFASSGLTSVVSTLLIRPYAFTQAEQLILRAKS